MSKIILIAVANCIILSSNLYADGFDNQILKLYKYNIVDAENSFENPSEFNSSERKIHWRNVFQTGIQCPFYETWRAKKSKNSKPQQLHLQFKKEVDVGTILAFANDRSVIDFSIKGKNITNVSTGGVVISPTSNLIKEIDFYSTKLQHQTLINWAGRKKVDSKQLSYYQFSLSGIYAIKEKRINIASEATAKVSGLSFRKRLENAERYRNSATSINDHSTFNYWRSDLLKENESAKAQLSFPEAVIVREIGLYFGNYLFNEMPVNVSISATDSDDKTFNLGVLNDFSRHRYTGKHFYLLRNQYPDRKIKTIKFTCKPFKNVVTISEVIVLAAPDDNSTLSKNESSRFMKILTVPAKGKKVASGVLKDKKNRIIKNFPPVKVLNDKFSFSWNGTNNLGKIVQPGNYRLKGVARAKLRVLYDSTPYSPAATPWVTPLRRGGWLSDHNAASTIERLREHLWVGAARAESGDTIMQLDFKGNKQWGARWLNLAGAKFIRAFNNKIYAAASGAWIGRKIYVTELDPKSKDFKTILKIAIPEDINKKHYKNDKRYAEKALSGFTINKKYIALAFSKVNRVELYKLNGNKYKSIIIASPETMRFDDKNNLLIISENKLIKVNISTEKTQNIITSNLVKPQDFVINQKHIVVADSGDNKVKVFKLSGKLLRKIGSNAIRQPGKYNPNILFRPVSIAVDSENQVWVTEDSLMPKRISVWNLNNGKFVREYLGPAKYAGGSWLDPKDKNIFYAEGMMFKRHESNWKLQAIYDNFISPSYKLMLKNRFYTGEAPARPVYYNNKLFMIRDRHWANAKIWYGIMGKDQVLKAYAALGSFSELSSHFKQRPPSWDGHSLNYTFLWVDANHDGEIEWSELQFTKAKYQILHWAGRMSKKLDFYFVLNNNEIYKLSANWQKGFPSYKLNKRKFITKLPKNKRIIALSPLPRKRLLINTKPLTCVDETTGKVLWTYPNPLPSNSHDSKLPEPGEIQHTLNVEGDVNIPGFGNVFLLNGNKGLRYLFSIDGVYIGKLFNDMRLASPLSVETVKREQDLCKYSLMDEAFNGSFERSSDGKVNFSGGKNHHSIYQITGLDSFKHFDQNIYFSKNEWEKARLDLSKRKNKELNSFLEAPPFIDKITAPLKLICNENNWKFIEKRKVGTNKKAQFTYRLALDKNYLYGAFNVSDDSPFVNNGTDWKMLFKSGDSINIELGLDKSPQISVNDIRLLIAPYKNVNIAVIYRYKLDGLKTQPNIFGSPVGKVRVDKIEQIKNAVIKVKRFRKAYFIEFKIPRNKIPALSGNPKSLYGDIGVIFSDDSGQRNRYNLFRYSPFKGVTADVPSEIRLLPQYWQKFYIK